MTQLFQRQVPQRLGSGPEDAEQIMNHRFFDHINWQDVILRQLVPPFKPLLVKKYRLNYSSLEKNIFF